MCEKVEFVDLYEYGYPYTEPQVHMARHLRLAQPQTHKSKGFFVFTGKDSRKRVVELFEYELPDGRRFQDRIVKDGDFETVVSAASSWQAGLSDQILEQAGEADPEIKSSILA